MDQEDPLVPEGQDNLFLPGPHRILSLLDRPLYRSLLNTEPNLDYQAFQVTRQLRVDREDP